MEGSIVLGTQFGDEAKGSFVNYLCENVIKNNCQPLVVRFNGGHQAGHTVFHNGIRHTFSSFGSGTLQNVPTLWSKFCTVYPTAVLNEYEILKSLGIKPNIYYDPLCPITTPYDILGNRLAERKNNHGTVGVGFGTTIKRHEAYYKLYFQDLFNKTVLEAKIKNIRSYYSHICYGDNENPKASNADMDSLESSMENWYKCIDTLIDEGIFSKDKMGLPAYHTYNYVLFEGAQGILLDMDFGFFPNVTRSNTTSKNAFTLIKEFGWQFTKLKINYVTRPYQTRHGEGFMSNTEFPEPTLINTENEINIDGGNQGVFRKSILDLDLIQYAIECDDNFSATLEKNIVISCLDQIKAYKNIHYTLLQKLYSGSILDIITDIRRMTNITGVYYGESEGKFIKQIAKEYDVHN